MGINRLYRDLYFSDQGMESRFLRSITTEIPLGGPAFRLKLSKGIELGPDDFQVVRTSGVGTTTAMVIFRAWQYPLEVRVHYFLKLTDPSFEKFIRVRWTGSSNDAPALEKVTLEEIPAAGIIRGGGAGRPVYTDNLFALVDSAWGIAGGLGDKVILAESPGVSLAGGWWTSSRSILGPCGNAPAPRAFIRWVAHRRGPTSLTLLASAQEGGENPPTSLSTIPLLQYGETLAQDLAPLFPVELGRPKGQRGGQKCLAIRLPAGLSAEDPLFGKSIQVALARLQDVGALVIHGLRKDGKTRALGRYLEYLRAFSFDLPVLVGWSGGKVALPLTQQVRLAGQDGLAGEGVLGRARARLSPWRRLGESWTRESADQLVWALASGCGFVHLGVVPPRGRMLDFLQGALRWTKSRGDLLQGMHRPFPGELPRLAGADVWLARSATEVLVVVRGAGPTDWRDYLPAKGKWEQVMEVWPGGKELMRDGVEAELSMGSAAVRVIHAWYAGEKVGQPLLIPKK